MIKKTKIIATIGPASWEDKILTSMIEHGMNGARINASFADHAEIEKVANQVRKHSNKLALIVDTKGHKIRVSDFKKDISLKQGKKFSLYTQKTPKGVYLKTEGSINLHSQIPKETVILIDDGLLKLKVIDKREEELICEVLQGGVLKRSKTVNIPGIHIEFGGISKKDYEDILYAKKLNIDFIALSFVRNANDIREANKLINGSNTKIIAKIENMEGVNNIDQILAEVEGIMIARGDLGVEIPAEKVPVLQQEFIKKCNNMGKIVIVATQMLQSMTENITPTRAEVNDVADAVADGADVVMLSAETSTGKHPAEAVETMARIATEIEKSVEPVDMPPSPLAKPATNAIAKSVYDSCQSLPIDKILVATGSGTTAKTIARFKLKQPIIAFTDNEFAMRKLALSKGVVPDILEEASVSRDTGVHDLVKAAKDKGHVSDSDMVIVVAGANIMGQGATNMLEINRVEQII